MTVDKITIDKMTHCSLGFGLGALIGIEMSGPVSGGHLNPAVSAGLVVSRRFPVFRAFVYVLGQCIGAISKASNLVCLSVRTHGEDSSRERVKTNTRRVREGEREFDRAREGEGKSLTERERERERV